MEWLKIGAVAMRLGLHVSTVRRMAEHGEIPHATTPQGTRLFDPVVIDALAARLHLQATSPRKEQHHDQ